MNSKSTTIDKHIRPKDRPTCVGLEAHITWGTCQVAQGWQQCGGKNNGEDCEGNHLSNTTRLTWVLCSSGEECSKLWRSLTRRRTQNKQGRVRQVASDEYCPPKDWWGPTTCIEGYECKEFGKTKREGE